ncbi:MAG: hypothetical protein ACK559_33470, partial [bacterium]
MHGDVYSVGRISRSRFGCLRGVVRSADEERIVAGCETMEGCGDGAIGIAVAIDLRRQTEVGTRAVGRMTDVGEVGQTRGIENATGRITRCVEGVVVADRPIVQCTK